MRSSRIEAPGDGVEDAIGKVRFLANREVSARESSLVIAGEPVGASCEPYSYALEKLLDLGPGRYE